MAATIGSTRKARSNSVDLSARSSRHLHPHDGRRARQHRADEDQTVRVHRRRERLLPPRCRTAATALLPLSLANAQARLSEDPRRALALARPAGRSGKPDRSGALREQRRIASLATSRAVRIRDRPSTSRETGERHVAETVSPKRRRALRAAGVGWRPTRVPVRNRPSRARCHRAAIGSSRRPVDAGRISIARLDNADDVTYEVVNFMDGERSVTTSATRSAPSSSRSTSRSSPSTSICSRGRERSPSSDSGRCSACRAARRRAGRGHRSGDRCRVLAFLALLGVRACGAQERPCRQARNRTSSSARSRSSARFASSRRRRRSSTLCATSLSSRRIRTSSRSAASAIRRSWTTCAR